MPITRGRYGEPRGALDPEYKPFVDEAEQLVGATRWRERQESLSWLSSDTKKSMVHVAEQKLRPTPKAEVGVADVRCYDLPGPIVHQRQGSRARPLLGEAQGCCYDLRADPLES